MIDIVLGLGFGDEGKGSVVNYLCNRTHNSLVVRFNGGPQAGHTVENRDGTRHVFHHFGSGTLQNIPTFWSKYCTVDPVAFANEYGDLRKLCIKPKIFIDPMAPVTTIYDVFYNQALEKCRESSKHGSVGMGIGATHERQETPHKLFFKDIFYKDILEHKLKDIYQYYICEKCKDDRLRSYFVISDFDKAELLFRTSINVIKSIAIIAQEFNIFNHNIYNDLIFEGAQGILLDAEHGFFPYVTRSNTTSKNAIEILKRNNKLNDLITINYVSRCYATRHGAGPFPGEKQIDHLKNGIEDRTNTSCVWQNDFKLGCLDINLMKYALMTDKIYSVMVNNRKLFLTHMDELKTHRIKIKHGEEYKYIDIFKLKEMLGYDGDDCFISESPYSEFK